MPFSVAFSLATPHGLCVGVRLPERGGETADLALGRLSPEERSYAASLPFRRRISWVGGRLALRAALAAMGRDAEAILSTERGAPRLPAGIAGSVSHTSGLAVALVAPSSPWSVGVDVEHAHPSRMEIARYVLTAEEWRDLESLPEEVHWREVLLRFSTKEALYKALDPFVRRYVGFKEVGVDPIPGGVARLRLLLPQGEGPFQAEARWRTEEDLVITTARVRSAATRPLSA